MQKYLLSGSDWKMKEFLGEDWVWRNAHRRKTGDVRWWKPGNVPSSVTWDLWKNGEIPDPHVEKNSLLLEWIPQRTWVYRKNFRLPEEFRGKRLELHFEGVDYECEVFVNDVSVIRHKGMFTEFSCDVTELLDMEEENLIAVVIHRAPDEEPQVSRTRYVKTHKSRMTYWWDFCPRMIHLGIWGDVWLEAVDSVRIYDTDVEVSLDQGQKNARIRGTVRTEGAETVSARLLFEDTAAAEQTVTADGDTAMFVLDVKEPKLWWPNGYGEQPLYRLEVTAQNQNGDSDRRDFRIGIRDLKFVKNENADESARPYTACVNGRKIYMKGYNWVPIDAMYGHRDMEKMTRLLTMAKEAHVNCLRIWGGGLIEREEFYDFCDENGILLWQEFIQSSSGIENEPSKAPEFLEMMRQEARQIIRRKKHHPSLAVWGGGNELSGPDESMISMEEPVIRVLAETVRELDPSRYFLESSPTGRVFNNTLENIAQDPTGLHDVHGPWEHQGLEEQYKLYNAGTSLLSSEFGVEGMTNFDVLSRNMKEEHLWPPSRDNEYYFHRGSWWNNYPLLQKCFGNCLTEIKSTVRASQFLQYEGLKYAVEANRRRALTCSGTFPWQFNEPYPNNTCTCSVDYESAPKPVYYGVRAAYAPDTVTAGFDSQTLHGRESFSADIYWQSSEKDRMPHRIRARVVQQDGKICAEREIWPEQTEKEAEKAVFSGSISCSADRIERGIFYLCLDAFDKEERKTAQNRYCFTTEETLAPLLALPEAELSAEAEAENDGYVLNICNTGRTVAAAVWLEEIGRGEECRTLLFDENYFFLLPGEKRKIRIRETKKEALCIRVSAFNLREEMAVPLTPSSE